MDSVLIINKRAIFIPCFIKLLCQLLFCCFCCSCPHIRGGRNFRHHSSAILHVQTARKIVYVHSKCRHVLPGPETLHDHNRVYFLSKAIIISHESLLCSHKLSIGVILQAVLTAPLRKDGHTFLPRIFNFLIGGIPDKICLPGVILFLIIRPV